MKITKWHKIQTILTDDSTIEEIFEFAFNHALRDHTGAVDHSDMMDIILHHLPLELLEEGEQLTLH